MKYWPRWKKLILVVLVWWGVSAVVSAITPASASVAAGGILVVALLLAIGLVFRSGSLSIGSGSGVFPGRRKSKALLFRCNGALFPHGTLALTSDSLNAPWHELLARVHKTGSPMVVVPTENNWVSEYGVLAQVLSIAPLYEIVGGQRVRVLSTRQVNGNQSKGRNWSNVFQADFMTLEDTVDEPRARSLADQVKRKFAKYCERRPNGSRLAAEVSAQTDPAAVAGLVLQELLGSQATLAANVLRADDVAFRLSTCADLMVPPAIPSISTPGGGGGADITAPSELPNFTAVGGMTALKEQLRHVIGLARQMSGTAEEWAVNSRGILLYGPPGTGKTFIARATAGEFGLSFISVSGGDVTGGLVGDSERKLREVFSSAAGHAPCLLFLDEIDSLASRRDDRGGDGGHDRRLVAQLLRCLEEVRNEPNVFVMAATNDVESLDEAVVRPGRFDHRVRVDLPDEGARVAILQTAVAGLTAENLDLQAVSKRTAGRSSADLVALIEAAKLYAVERASGSRPVLSQDDIETSIRSRGGNDAPTLAPVQWDDLVLPAETKAQLMDLTRVIADAAAGRVPRRKPPTGAILYGPPGTGKTTIARAIATELKGTVSFLPVKGSDIRGKWIGDSAKNVKNLFARARASSPAIIFIDEIDALLGERKGGDGGNAEVDEQIVTEFLQQLDGIDSTPGIFVLGATNHLGRIDPGVKRGGRLGRAVEIPLPDVTGRQAILGHVLGLGLCHVDVDVVARATERYSGADLEALCAEAEEEADRSTNGQPTTETFMTVLGRRRKGPRFEYKSWGELILPAQTLKELQSLARLIGDPEAAREHGIKVPRGALLWGPPGTGKTTIARVLASQLSGQVAFLSAMGSDLRSKWAGEGEKNLRLLFEQARAQTPAMIFLDEIEALTPNRDMGGDGGGGSLLTEFLQQLDGVDSTPGVFVLGATNRPQSIDPAATRGGRLGRLIEIPLPDLEGRVRLLELHTASMKLAPDLDLVAVAPALEGASGADVESVCNTAGEISFNGEDGPRFVTRADFDQAVGSWLAGARRRL